MLTGTVLLGVSIFLTVVEGYRGNFDLPAALSRDFGSFILVTGSLAVFWEILAKRLFLREILDAVQLSEATHLSGLADVTFDFYDSISWSDLIGNAREIDTFYSFGSTWRGRFHERLHQLAGKRNVRMNVILPDSDDERVVDELSQRYAMDKERVIRQIESTAKFFYELQEKSPEIGFVTVWFTKIPPTYTFYRFDDTIVMALYKHTEERTGVPVFLVRKGGSLYDFVMRDIRALNSASGGRSRIDA